MTSDLGRAPWGVVGSGRVGRALAHALLAAGRPLDRVASRRPEAARELAAGLPFVVASEVPELVSSCDLVFLAVPDGAIGPLAGELTWRPGQAVVHLSGAIDTGALSEVTRAGGRAGCLHPLQTFPQGESGAEARTRFSGIAFGVEGEPPLGPLLEALAEALGGYSFRLEGVRRAGYHAAAVLASNLVVAVLSGAMRAWEQAGLPAKEAQRALTVLLRAQAEAASGRPLVEALTGPVARGDVETVAGHLEALSTDPGLEALYRGLSRELLRLGLDHSSERREELAQLLGDG